MRFLGLLLMLSTTVGAQQQPAVPSPSKPQGSTPPSPTAQGAAAGEPGAGRVFASEAGMIFTAVKPDKVQDFEVVLGRLREALKASPDPQRQKQAAAWKVFKASEAGPGGSVLFVFVMDPVVPGADYGVARVLAEAFPSEAQTLYKLYTGALATGQTLLNLHTVETSERPQ